MADIARRTKNFTGHKHTEETKARISAAKKGVKFGKYNKDRVEKTAAAMRESKSKLNEDSVREVRILNKAGVPHRDIAKKLGVSYSAVADIARNRTFRWVI